MAGSTVAPGHDARRVAELLDLPQVGQLIADLGETRWTGRPGYPIRTRVGACLVKAVYALPTWTRTARLIAEHAALREAIGGSPSHWACYRFAVKLREHGDALTGCLDRLLATLHAARPEMGEHIAIDGSDLPAYANGHAHVGSKDGPERTHYADPDASWGHRSAISTRKGGGFYGYKVHAAVCTATGLPVAWNVRPAGESEQEHALPLLGVAQGRGFAPSVAIMDKGYDGSAIYAGCEARGVRPVIPLKLTVNVANGLDKPPTCRHGRWTFAGSDVRRGAAKYRCPTGACQPASVWIKADRLHTLIPRETPRWKATYRERVAVEREFGVLKHS